MMTAAACRPLQLHRSMGGYLGEYIAQVSIMVCPSAPRESEYLQAAWDAEDDWNNPLTFFPSDLVLGAYCFYWDYVGFLGYDRAPFRGPRGPARGRGQSKVLVSDYFGFDHHRSPEAYGSSERFKGAGVTLGTEVSSAYWSCDGGSGVPDVKPYAGYTDGHVESFRASEVVPMRVSTEPDGSVPYQSGIGIGGGVFYLPTNGLR